MEEDYSQDPLFNRDKLKELLSKRAFGAPVDPAAPIAPAEPAPAAAAPAAAEKPIEWSQVPEEAIKNLPESASGVVSSMFAPILHPIDTAEAVGTLAKGAYSKGVGALGVTQDAAQKAKDEQALNAAMDFYKQRYGSEEGFKQALAKDPAGVAADFSALFTGGGSLAARLPGTVGRVGKAAVTAGRVMDPIGAAVSKTVSSVAKPATAVIAAPASALYAFTTGKPIKKFQDAARAGFAHNPEFLRHFSGEKGAEEIVSRVEGGLNKLADQRSKDYIAGMADPIKSQTPLGFGEIDKALTDARTKFEHLGKVYNQEAKNAYDEALTKIDQWKNQPAQPGANALEDFDKLKRALSEVHSKYSREFGAESPAARIASDLRRSVFETIKNQDPRYAEVMEKYEQSSQKIKEIRKELLGGKTTTVGAKIRKVLKSQNDSHKGKLLAELEAIDPDIGFALAGNELSALLPQGMIGKIMAGGLPLAAGAATFNPAAILAGAAASPMLTGSTMYGLGALGGLPGKISPSLPYAAGEARERERARKGRATGGKVQAMTADKLIRMAEAAKRSIGKHTEEILKAPDEHVVRALDIANKHI